MNNKLIIENREFYFHPTYIAYAGSLDQGSAIMAREVILYDTRRREYFSKTRLQTFFFFRDHPDFERKIGKSEMKSK